MSQEKVMQVFDALQKFINEKPELDPADYGCHAEQRAYTSSTQWWDAIRAMRQDENRIKRDGTKARKALKEARAYPANWDALQDAFRSAFSGRLSINSDGTLEYCTGQYYPTEYRAASLAVLERYNHMVKPKFTPPNGTIFYSSSDIERAADRAGSHFFDRDTKRFFRSRILPDAFHGNGGCYFVTSEQYVCGERKAERRYTVRAFNPETADISSFGPFNVLTKAQALRAARVASEYPDAAKEYLSQFKEAWER